MLFDRKLINDIEKERIKLGNLENKITFEITLNNDSVYSIYIINSELSSVVKNSSLDNYLSNNVNIHKIIIIKMITKKACNQLNTEYRNTEFIFEHELMEHIPSKVFIPKHQLLSPEEKNELLEKFNENNLSEIFTTDVMSRYYGAKSGDIFRIIRPSITAGNNIFYRRVVKGSLDILFS
jgi:DNA-directed RNA polymerase I, II, and III subunit RPABC1